MKLNSQKLDSLVQRVFGEISAGYGGVLISIGEKLGLYKAMAGAGPLSSHEVAKRAACAHRYVLEWLNAQVAGGYLDYHPSSQTYELSAEQALVFADPSSPAYMPPAWQVVASMWADEAKTLTTFKTGKGLSWGEHDARLFCGVGAFYRNAYQASLINEWIPALTGVKEKLIQGAKVADIGCGHGHSTILMAQAFPKSKFWGFDVHAASIATAKENARQAGVTDRVNFEVAPADGYTRNDYDLIGFFDCLHDMGQPVEAIRYAVSSLVSHGTVMLIEPLAADCLEDNINPIGRLYYAASTTMCCAHAISENGTHVLGAQAGPRQIEDVLRTGGLKTVRQALTTPFNIVFEAKKE